MSIAQKKARVTAAEFAAKFTNKREIYRFLASEVNLYVPPIDNVTVWHLRDMARGERTRIEAKDVKHVAIPQFKGLGIKEMMEYAHMFPEVMKAFPTGDKEAEKLPRQYIANVIHTLVGKPFRQWIDAKLEERNAELVEKKEMIIELDPEIEALFKASNSVSGRFCGDRTNMHFSTYLPFFSFSQPWHQCFLDEEERQKKKDQG